MANKKLSANSGNLVLGGVVEFESTPALSGGGEVVDTVSAQSIGGDKTFSNNVIITGNLTVNGTTTTLNTATLDVEDFNITLNVGGNDATAEGAGITINRTGTNASIVYENALISKFKLGLLGSESEVITAAGEQTLSGEKTFTTTILGSINGNAASSSTTYVERDDSTNANRYLTFVDSLTAGNQRLNMDTGLYYNPSANELICDSVYALNFLKIRDDGANHVATINASDLSANYTFNIPNVGSSDFVMTAGTQTIGGIKTFSSRVDVNHAGDEMFRLIDTSATGSPYLSFYQTTTRRSYIQYSDSLAALLLRNEERNVNVFVGHSTVVGNSVRFESPGTSNYQRLGVFLNPSQATDRFSSLIFGRDDAGGEAAEMGWYRHPSNANSSYLYLGAVGAANQLRAYRAGLLESHSNHSFMTAFGTNWPGLGGIGSPNWIGFKWNGSILARVDNVTTITLQAASDYRLKTEVELYSDPVGHKMMQLAVKRFYFTDFEGVKRDAEHKSVGMMAHEVSEFFPEIVTGTKDEINPETGMPEYQSVFYPGLTNHLILWGQEQQREIDQLKSKVEALEAVLSQ